MFIHTLVNSLCVLACVINNRKEGNVLFNDALNTFYFTGYMASDILRRTIQIVRQETHCRHMGYSFYTTAFVTPVMEHWLEQ